MPGNPARRGTALGPLLKLNDMRSVLSTAEGIHHDAVALYIFQQPLKGKGTFLHAVVKSPVPSPFLPSSFPQSSSSLKEGLFKDHCV